MRRAQLRMLKGRTVSPILVYQNVDGLREDRREVEILNEECDQTAVRVSPSGSVSRRKHLFTFVHYNHIPAVAVAKKPALPWEKGCH